MDALPAWARQSTSEELATIAEVVDEYEEGEATLPCLITKLSEISVASAAVSLRVLAGELTEEPGGANARARLVAAAAAAAAAAIAAST